MKLLGVMLALAAGAGGVASWTHGGPREAVAVARLDGWHAIPLLPPDWSTCYAASFTHAAFLASQPGDTAESVRARLGDPLTITRFDELALRAPFVTFVKSGGQWVVASASGVDAPRGATMSSIEALGSLPNEDWSYSQSCTSEQSVRLRGLTLRDGRVVRRNFTVIYD